MRGQIAIDALFAVLILLTMLGIFTAFVDRGSVEIRRGLQYVVCDLAGSKTARTEALLRLSGLGHAPGTVENITLSVGGGVVSPAQMSVRYNDENVEITITYTGTTIECMGRAVPQWP